MEKLAVLIQAIPRHAIVVWLHCRLNNCAFVACVVLFISIVISGCKNSAEDQNNGQSELTYSSESANTAKEKSANENTEPDPPKPSTLSKHELYKIHCATCHGSNGNALGPGSQSIFPPARNFRTEPFRLVSSKNRIASRDDIRRAIVDGVPGTSMISFRQLHKDDHEKLTDMVIEFWKEGTREAILAEAPDDPPSAAQLSADVALLTSANETVSIANDILEQGSVERGREIYFAQSCQSCHGDDGRGNPETDFYDTNGLPTRPRDLVNEPMKGGSDPLAIYLRLRLGMPGTTHPNNENLDDQQFADLVAFVRSLAAKRTVVMTGFQRRSYSRVREYLKVIDELPRAEFSESN